MSDCGRVFVLGITIVVSVALIDNLCAAQTSTIVDSRDGKTYKTIQVGRQLWMAQNLAYAPIMSFTFNNKTEGDSLTGSIQNEGREYKDSNYESFAYCYNDSVRNYEKYGALYTWEAALIGCPSGWHLPSEQEFDSLLTTIGGNRKNVYRTLIGGGASGFEGQLAGGLYHFQTMHPSFIGKDNAGFFWTSSEITKPHHERKVVYAVLYRPYHNVMKKSSMLHSHASYSVRCVKD